MFENTELIDPAMQKNFLNAMKRNYVYQRIAKQGTNLRMNSAPLNGPNKSNSTHVIFEMI